MIRLASSSGKAPAPIMIALGVGALVVLILTGLLLFQLNTIKSEMSRLADEVTRAGQSANQAREKAEEAASQARLAEEHARAAVQEKHEAQQATLQARHDATRAEEESSQTKAQLEEMKAQAESELSRLHDALAQVVETRRTALGLVMNLGSDALEFDFDKAILRPENRELLSRIAGILLTSHDFGIYVHGHTDDVGSDRYNQELSEKRAEAVRDYLVAAGIAPDRIETKGWGKSQPLVAGSSPEARARNRRVEIGIVNTSVHYTKSIPESARD